MPPSHQYRQRDYEFANTFVSLRTSIGLTQQGLAKILGVSSKAVENWEQGLTGPKAEYLKAFLVLCVHASAFAVGREEEQIRALWRAARQRALLDEHWLTELLNPSSVGNAGELSGEDRPSSTTTPRTPAIWMVPYLRNPHFTGRNELLDHLQRQFALRENEQQHTTIHHAALTQSQAIKGLGGIGKTQTAIEYAYRARERGRYTHTLWISAASEEAVMSSFAALKDRVPALEQEEESDQRALVNKALRWLEQCPDPWLLIYDNADDITFLPAYLPKEGWGSILLTTRASAIGALAESLEVDALPLEDAIHLLLRRAGCESDTTPQEREEASTIVLALGQFPLAIDQAGAYIEETGCSLADYLLLYQQHQHELLARRGRQTSGYPDSVATTWSLAFEQIEEHHPAAAELLQVCAFMAPDQIPEELLTEGASYWPAALQEVVTDRLRFNQMLSTLLSFSLIKRMGRERQLSMHRLVQVVQQARMTPEEQRQWALRLVFTVLAVFPRESDAFASWQVCQRLLQQVLACETLIEQHKLLLPEAADLLDRTGKYLIARALYSLAEPLLRRALGMREQLLGPEHLDVAISLHHLGGLCWHLGKYAEAEPLYQRALHIREQYLGPEHYDVAELLNDLALLYYDQGNRTQAELLYLRVLHILERLFGPDHPDATFPLRNLALLYHDQGKYAQAERLCLRALRIDEQHLGSEHPNLAMSLQSLAKLYWKLRKYAQAEPLYQRVLRICEQHMGTEHPNVASIVVDLARLSYDQGQYIQAEQLCQRALRIYEQRLGPEHPSGATPLHWLALVTAQIGTDEESERLERQALHIWEHLGPEHPSVAYALHGLARLCVRQGRESEAEALFQRALCIREQKMGEMHLDMADLQDDFAGFRHRQGRTQEAAVLYRRALTTREHVLGPDHPSTLETHASLQAMLFQLQEAASGETLSKQEEMAVAKKQGQEA
jgi:tetratricopeptide (TPR) repeat protein